MDLLTTRVKVGIATMNAGLGMPGATFQETLESIKGLEVMVVDGNITDYSKNFYENNKIKYLSKPWVGSLLLQYQELLTQFNKGDWWVMLDDDEILSPELLRLLIEMDKNLSKGLPAFEGLIENPERIYSVSTPRVTCFTEGETEDGKFLYYPGEIPPNANQKNNVYPSNYYAGPRAHIFRIDPAIKMMHSPAGRHVVPYYPTMQDYGIYMANPFVHYHLKAPELYVYNDCVKAMFDQDIKDPKISDEYRKMLADNNIVDERSFMDVTITNRVNQNFKDFCIKYKDHGAPEGRLFIWYYNILHPKDNPYQELDWTASLKKVLNPRWREIYLENKQKAPFLSVKKVELKAVPTWYPKGKGNITL